MNKTTGFAETDFTKTKFATTLFTRTEFAETAFAKQTKTGKTFRKNLLHIIILVIYSFYCALKNTDIIIYKCMNSCRRIKNNAKIYIPKFKKKTNINIKRIRSKNIEFKYC